MDDPRSVLEQEEGGPVSGRAGDPISFSRWPGLLLILIFLQTCAAEVECTPGAVGTLVLGLMVRVVVAASSAGRGRKGLCSPGQ